MNSRLIYIIGIVYLIWTAMSCASAGTLGGGPKDNNPPKLLDALSTPNLMTNFDQQEIIMEFDEYIEVKNATKNIIVTPPLTYIPQTKLRGKKLRFILDEREVLRPNITYVVNFGEAIQDYHEGNKLKNFRYVFSTGPFIDSLSIEGIVEDEETKKAASKTLVMVYEENNDSCVIRGKPYYVGRTTEDGSFRIDFMKPGTYRVYACSDDNNSLFYNAGSERVGFLTEDIVVDSNIIGLKLSIGQAAFPLKYIKSESTYKGHIKLIYNQPVKPFDLQPIISNGQLTHFRNEKDTLHVYTLDKSDSLTILVPSDTIQIRQGAKVDSSEVRLSIPDNVGNYISGDTLVFRSRYPIDKVEPGLMVDSTNEALDHNAFIMPDGFGMGVVIPILDTLSWSGYMLPEKVYNMNSMTNDTIPLTIRPAADSVYTNVKIIITDMDSSIVHLIAITQNNIDLWQSKTIDKDTLIIDLGRLSTIPIYVTITQDLNSNSRRDLKSIWGRLPAEPTIVKEYNTFKGGWTHEEIISVNTLLGKQDPPLSEEIEEDK